MVLHLQWRPSQRSKRLRPQLRWRRALYESLSCSWSQVRLHYCVSVPIQWELTRVLYVRHVTSLAPPTTRMLLALAIIPSRRHSMSRALAPAARAFSSERGARSSDSISACVISRSAFGELTVSSTVTARSRPLPMIPSRMLLRSGRSACIFNQQVERPWSVIKNLAHRS
jgi:hypothetical protein